MENVTLTPEAAPPATLTPAQNAAGDIDAALVKLAHDAGAPIHDAVAFANAAKAGDWLAAAAKLPLLARESLAVISDVREATPLIVSGFKSSEFAAGTIFALANAAWLVWKGVPLPAEFNNALAAVTTAYIAGRTILKAVHKPAAPVAAAPAYLQLPPPPPSNNSPK